MICVCTPPSLVTFWGTLVANDAKSSPFFNFTYILWGHWGHNVLGAPLATLDTPLRLSKIYDWPTDCTNDY